MKRLFRGEGNLNKLGKKNGKYYPLINYLRKFEIELTITLK